MPNILCPKCNSTLAIADESVGQMVQCGSCQNVFKAVALPPEDAEDRPSKRKRSSRKGDDDDDDEDERPSKRKRSKRDDDDDDDDDADRPKKKKRKHYHDDDDDDDEDDDERRPAKQAASNGMATASMVLGIIALVIELPSFGGTIFGTACCVLCGVLFWPGHAIAVILAIIGVILGLLAMKKPGGKGAWIAGLILSGITLALAIVMVLLYILGFAMIATMPTQPQPTNNAWQPGPQPPINKPRR